MTTFIFQVQNNDSEMPLDFIVNYYTCLSHSMGIVSLRVFYTVSIDVHSAREILRGGDGKVNRPKFRHLPKDPHL